MIPGEVITTERRVIASPTLIGGVAIVMVVLVGIVWFGRGTSAAPPEAEGTVPVTPTATTLVPQAAAQSETVTVHVAGEVTRPGLVVVPVDARVAEAIVAAGGATAHADLSLLNLAAGVADGTQVVVPRFGSSVGPAAGPVADVDGRVHVNSAGLDDLMRLPGIGPITARRIIEYRTAHGPFHAVEDLLDVPGIGEGKLESVRDGVVIP